MKTVLVVISFLLLSRILAAQVKVVGNYDQNFYYDTKPLKKIKGVKWKYKTEGIGTFMPLVHDGVIYSGDNKGNLYAIDTRSGEQIWVFHAEGRLFNGPSIKDESLFFGSFGGIIYALDIHTGKEKWRIQTGGSVCFPSTIEANTGYALSHDRKIYIFDLDNGNLKDKIRGDYWMCGIPSISHNHIHYPDWGGEYAFNGPGIRRKRVEFHAGSHSRRYTCASIHDSVAYFVTSDSIVYGIDLNNGQAFWSFKADNKITRSPAITNNLIAFTTFNSHLYVIDRGNGKVLWDYISAGSNNSHPIIVDDVVYFGSGNGILYALMLDLEKNYGSIKQEVL